MTRRGFAFALMTLVSSAMAQSAPPSDGPASVAAANGRIIVKDASGLLRPITTGPMDRDPILSADRQTVVFVRVEKEARADEPDDDGDYTSLWAWTPAMGARKLAGWEVEVPSPVGAFNLRGIWSLRSSLDGGFVYALVSGGTATTSSVVQFNLKTAGVKFVSFGNSNLVIRTGKWAGYLMIRKHKYYPQGGARDPMTIVRPDGVEMLEIKGTDDGESEESIKLWLTQNKAVAW